MPQTERPTLSASQPTNASPESLAAEIVAYAEAIEADDFVCASLGDILVEASSQGRADLAALILSVSDAFLLDPHDCDPKPGSFEHALSLKPKSFVLSNVEISISRALFQACSRGHAECVRLLAPKTPFTNGSNTGRGLVHLSNAAGANHLDCVKALLPFVDLTTPESIHEHPLPIAASKLGISAEMLTFLADLPLADQTLMGALSVAAHRHLAENASTLLSLLFSKANQEGPERFRYAISSPEGRRLPSSNELLTLASTARDGAGPSRPLSPAQLLVVNAEATSRLFQSFAALAEKMDIEASGAESPQNLAPSKAAPRI